MFEDEPTWTVATTVGAETYEDLAKRLDLSREMVNNTTDQHHCIDCNFPGGGANSSAFDRVSKEVPATEEFVQEEMGRARFEREAIGEPFDEEAFIAPATQRIYEIIPRDWVADDFDGVNVSAKTPQTKPCMVTDGEKARCPAKYLFFESLLCTSGRCNTQECPRCKGRSRTGRMQEGDILMVSGVQCTFLPQPNGDVAATMVPSHRCGKYLGVDAGGTLRFELMKPDGGEKQSTGMRFWLTPSGYFVEDLAPEVRDALSIVKTPGEKKLWKPGDDPNA